MVLLISLRAISGNSNSLPSFSLIGDFRKRICFTINKFPLLKESCNDIKQMASYEYQKDIYA